MVLKVLGLSPLTRRENRADKARYFISPKPVLHFVFRWRYREVCSQRKMADGTDRFVLLLKSWKTTLGGLTSPLCTFRPHAFTLLAHDGSLLFAISLKMGSFHAEFLRLRDASSLHCMYYGVKHLDKYTRSDRLESWTQALERC